MLKYVGNWLRRNFLQTLIYSKRKTEMIEIKILNPHTADKFVLRETAKYLLSLAGDVMVAENEMPVVHPAVANAHVVSPIPLPPAVPVEPPAGYLVGDDEIPQDSCIPSPPVLGSIPDMPPAVPNLEPSSFPAMPNPFGNKELDVHGLPWDNRIHARTKTKTADGAWKLMRGVEQDLVKQIESQLRGALNAPSAPPITPVVQSTPVHIPTPPAEVDTSSAWFTAMAKITAVVKDGQMTHGQVMAIVKSMGLESVPLIAQRPDLIPAILHRIDHFVQHGQFL
jgi:hypothetical protein